MKLHNLIKENKKLFTLLNQNGINYENLLRKLEVYEAYLLKKEDFFRSRPEIIKELSLEFGLKRRTINDYIRFMKITLEEPKKKKIVKCG